MLELKNVVKVYKMPSNDYTALKDVHLIFRDAEFVSILGQSGCGKTTLLNIIGGLDRLTQGDLIINGKSTKDYKDRDWDTYRNHSIGFVFQSYNLIPHQTILQNVELALSIGGISKKERRSRAIDVLNKVGLGEHINKKPNQLSGGQCQRVSIARALVNNPEIILADEPTGALDSETSVQVMEILKKISKDRLVIMVTHNPDLAKQYSTRIVNMLDGEITNDSNPVTEKEYQKISKNSEKILNFDEKTQKNQGKHQKKIKKYASMSLFTSIMLSLKNLLTKKKRTFLTSFACSIGIIGIAIILSVSAGMNLYINDVQKDSASINYVSVSVAQVDYEMLINSYRVTNLPEYPENTTGVIPYKSQNNSVKQQIINQNYIDYINNMDPDWLLATKYQRNIGLNIVGYSNNKYSKINTSNWTEIVDNTDFISNQYTTLYKGADNISFPTHANEIALVVDRYNRLDTRILDRLGIQYDSNLTTIPYEDIIDKEFSLVLNDDFFTQTTFDGKEVYVYNQEQTSLQNYYNLGVRLKIVCILRENKGVNANWISSGIGYTPNLTDYIVEHNKNSQVVIAQKANPTYSVITSQDFDLNTNPSAYEQTLTYLGENSTPATISLYPNSLKDKDLILAYLDAWNDSKIYEIYGYDKDENGNYLADKYKVEYTDMGQLFSSLMGDIINIITYVLIAFSAISLVVSSIMIAIITYTSVIERIKEIGVLRSLGARKKDISRLFIAEASILGLLSGIIALIATLILNLIINIILGNLVGIWTIASLKWTTALLMLALCVGLNVIAGLIPAKIASKKDPVVALRTE